MSRKSLNPEWDVQAALGQRTTVGRTKSWAGDREWAFRGVGHLEEDEVFENRMSKYTKKARCI